MRVHRLTSAIICSFLLAACQGSGDDSPRSFLERRPAEAFQLRVLSWNVKFGSIFPPEGRRHAGFARIVRAVDPDVLVLQEVDPGEVDRLARLMDRIVPLGHSRLWQIHGAADNVIISRYPLLLRASELVVPRPLPWYPDFRLGQAMALVDLPDRESDHDVFVVGMHNRSRAGEANERKRQLQSDSLARWLRDRRQSGAIPAGTPLLIAGDMNLYPGAPARHLATLLVGDIADEASFGPDFAPDWDGTGLSDARPSHNAKGDTFYTWRDDSQEFPPGQLSRILYTDSVMSLRHTFVLNTVDMLPAELADHGLEATDGLLDAEPGLFDHMPVVADFELR